MNNGWSDPGLRHDSLPDLLEQALSAECLDLGIDMTESQWNHLCCRVIEVMTPLLEDPPRKPDKPPTGSRKGELVAFRRRVYVIRCSRCGRCSPVEFTAEKTERVARALGWHVTERKRWICGRCHGEDTRAAAGGTERVGDKVLPGGLSDPGLEARTAPTYSIICSPVTSTTFAQSSPSTRVGSGRRCMSTGNRWRRLPG